MKRSTFIRTLVLALCLAITVSSVSLPVFAEAAPAMPDENNPGFTHITGSGTEADPYIITDVDGWIELSDFINTEYDGNDDKDHTYFSGRYFKLGNDVDITTALHGLGKAYVKNSDLRRFGGVFDGDGHTLTVNFHSDNFKRESDNKHFYCAPFSIISGATIKNLTIDGTITVKDQYAAGLVGIVISDINGEPSYIDNCHIQAVLNLAAVSGGGFDGGFVAIVEEALTSNTNVNTPATLYITNSSFEGTMQGYSDSSKASKCGGFVGYNKGITTITGCIFAPEHLDLDTNGAYTFIYPYSNNATSNLTDVYYTATLGKTDTDAYQAFTADPQDGKTYDTFTAADGNTYYRRVYSITNNSNGKVICPASAAAGTLVSLTALPDPGEELQSFTVKNGNKTVTVTDGQFKMPDATVTVSAAFQTQTIPSFKSASLTLGDDIGVRLGVDTVPLTPEQTANSYVKFTVCGAETTVPFSDAEEDGGLYFFPCHVNVIQMADNITAEFCYNDGTGDRSVTREISVTYLIDLYYDYYSGNQSGQDLVKALNDLGYYSQQYLSRIRSWTLGTDHVAVEAPYEASFDTAAIKTAISGKQVAKDLQSADIQKVSCSLVLESKTALNLFITPAGGCSEFTATVDGASAEVVDVGDGTYMIAISDIGPRELGHMYNVRITSASGVSTVSVSAMSYVYACLSASDSNGRNNCVSALYEYYRAAEAWQPAQN